MAKPQDDPAAQAPAAVPTVSAALSVTFRDTLYTSRTVILPDGRTLAVAGALVTVEAGDDTALKCLKAHPEYEQLKE
ncbi:hypothetical protein [Pseudomonas sp. B11(2017)]|uniref:hypothetical protein n=1 Tax=Pseudomonas sp. B11(2017) TaxID=1981748 RepID=UPI000A1F7E62|nr:hypothetical protein [Pseudomonas sp. B11(2017)]